MNTPITLTRIQKTKLETLARRYGIELAILFGSRARGDAHQGSDLDVGVLFAPRHTPSPHQMDALETRVLALFQDNVHLVSLNFVNPELRRAAEQEGQVLYERTRGIFAGFIIENLHLLHQYNYLRQYDRDFLNRFLRGSSHDQNLHRHRRAPNARQHSRGANATQRS